MVQGRGPWCSSASQQRAYGDEADASAMRKIHADGAAVCEGHPDLEVFRLRLGKALDFDYFEDWQGSLFSRADPRSAGPALDVERALNKLEKVALRYKRKNGRPLVLAFNGERKVHTSRPAADPEYRCPSLPERRRGSCAVASAATTCRGLGRGR